MVIDHATERALTRMRFTPLSSGLVEQAALPLHLPGLLHDRLVDTFDKTLTIEQGGDGEIAGVERVLFAIALELG